jgi:hypothetical protein
VDVMNDNRSVSIDRPGLAQLCSRDIAVAARTSVPVLISAPEESALPMALEIAMGCGDDGGVVVVDAADADHRHLRSTFELVSEAGLSPLRTIVVQGVEALDPAQQSALMALVADTAGPDSRACRIITTTSVPLFERVTQGSFDPDLFYRLNRIHIKVGVVPTRDY